MAYDTLNVSTDDFVTTVTLSRPERLNALNHQLADELFDVMHACDQSDDTRVFIITGAGRGFSAGADLKDRGAANDRPSNAPTLGERLYQALADIEKPLIAAINGVAVGGGCTLTLLCDIRVAAERAYRSTEERLQLELEETERKLTATQRKARPGLPMRDVLIITERKKL